MDYTRRAPGSEWNYTAYTLNRFRYPEDPRLHLGGYVFAVRNLHGKRFLYLTDMYADQISIFRFNPETDGEVAIPSGLFLFKREHRGAWPPNRPAAPGEFIWRDRNGNGAFDLGEYERREGEGSSWGRFVDTRGDLWQAFDTAGIRQIPCEGLDRHGNPIYSYIAARTFPMPEPFNRLQRVVYQPETDTMYLAGFTSQHPYDEIWGVVGRVVCRYDRWSQGNRISRWQLTLPFRKGEPMKAMKAMHVEGDYLFAVDVREANVYVYRAS
ncbi:MAG: hypothetical protein KY468_19185, partial [Armatimonadetes bacterium]|nr:hypothetical protein [Armatimonadota bacterium]